MQLPKLSVDQLQKRKEENNMTYHITTGKRVYNSVDSKKRWKKIRKLRNDASKVKAVFHWDKRKQDWVRINKQGW